MALIRFEHGVAVDADYDWTIIGCGAVGIFSALQLAEKGYKVLVLESGVLGEQSEFQALNQGTFNREDMAASATWGRKRALGGTTIRWGGQALPFRHVDFSRNTGIGEWMMGLEDLEESYLLAEEYLGVGKYDFWTALGGWGLQPQVADGLLYHASKWAPTPNMYETHRKKLLKVADVLFGAHVLLPIVKQRMDSRKITALRIGSLGGAELEIPVENVILANGTLESVRFLMLHSLSESPLLGKGFMEHPCADIGVCQTEDSLPLQRYFGTRMKNRRKYSVRLSLSEKLQQDEDLLAASASLMFEENTSEFPSPLTRMRALKNGSLNELLGVVRNSRHILIALREYLKYGIAYRPSPSIRISVMAEQNCLSESSIGLDDQNVDHFDQPRIKIDWFFDEGTLHAVRRIAGLVKEALETNSEFDTHVVLADWLRDEGATEFLNAFTPVNHHMGGAAMGNDDGKAIVDSRLRVYGLENLRLFSAAVFPSSSHSNPTLTVLALAHRSLASIQPR